MRGVSEKERKTKKKVKYKSHWKYESYKAQSFFENEKKACFSN